MAHDHAAQEQLMHEYALYVPIKSNTSVHWQRSADEAASKLLAEQVHAHFLELQKVCSRVETTRTAVQRSLTKVQAVRNTCQYGHQSDSPDTANYRATEAK